MPHTVAYQPDLMNRIFTPKRIYSYKRVFGDLSDREIVGIYIWNQTLAGELYPLLSATEITLRNAIDAAFIKYSGTLWWKKLKYKSYSPGHQIPFDIQAIKDNFSRATLYARKEKYRRYHKANYIPKHAEIVASTYFSTWEFVMSDELLAPHLFWGVMLTQVFKGPWPASTGTQTLDIARNRVKTIREYRNRLAHNEPLWKAYRVEAPTDAIAYIEEKIATMEQLIRLISPEKHHLLTKHGLFKNARRINSLAEIERFKTTLKPRMLDSFGNLQTTVQIANQHNNTMICQLAQNSQPFLIIPY